MITLALSKSHSRLLIVKLLLQLITRLLIQLELKCNVTRALLNLNLLTLPTILEALVAEALMKFKMERMQ